MVQAYSTLQFEAGMQIISHAAKTAQSSTPNTLGGIKECIAKEIHYIEVDISPLSYGDFLLFHNETLDALTNRSGPVFSLSRPEKQDLWYLDEHGEKLNRVAHLSEAIPLLAEDSKIKEFQLDLKTHASSPLTEEILRNLLGLIIPVKNRVRITSCADWAIRKLRHLDPEVKLGFDPHFFLDFGREESISFPPYRQTRFTYRDDHPIALYNWENPREYLAMRAESLWLLGADADIWYLRFAFLRKSMDDGFNWIEFLHHRGVQVCAWTLNIENGREKHIIEEVCSMNPDRISTDTPQRWRSLLKARNTA